MKKSVDPISHSVKARWEEIFEKASAAYKATHKQDLVQDEALEDPVKLKVSLEDLPHPCERVLLLPPDITMRQLHFFIQRSVGWKNAHLFEFCDNMDGPKIRVGMVFDDIEDTSPPTLDAHSVGFLSGFLTGVGRQAFYYLYDFGDHWVHKITILEPTKAEIEKFRGYPSCLGAVGKCPPEDVGSAGGYEDFLEVVNDPDHSQYKNYRRWAGLKMKGVYDPFKVDLDYINYRLIHFFLSKKYKTANYEIQSP